MDAGLLAEIREHPRRFYVNVHTGDFPAGAVRGQLKRKHHHGHDNGRHKGHRK